MISLVWSRATRPRLFLMDEDYEFQKITISKKAGRPFRSRRLLSLFLQEPLRFKRRHTS
jgi:hypothetical protein